MYNEILELNIKFYQLTALSIHERSNRQIVYKVSAAHDDFCLLDHLRTSKLLKIIDTCGAFLIFY